MQIDSVKYYLQKFPPLYKVVRSLNQVRVELLTSKLEQKRKKRFENIYRVSSLLMDEYGEEVFNGPFAGMKYPRSEGVLIHPAKLIASYEYEIREHIQAAVNKNYKKIINIGCADGYFAVGFAKACPEAQVFGYDIDERAIKQCNEHAKRNQITNISILGECNHSELAKNSGASSFIFSDCEGGEAELLDPEKCPELLEADFLIESHDQIVPNVTQTLINRFSNTHQHQVVSGSNRNPADFPQLEILSDADKRTALDELRGEGHSTWLVLSRHSN